MDIEYMQSLFHRTHYEFFYRALPSFLRSDVLGQVIDGGRQGIGNQYLVGFWRGTAKYVAGLALDDAVPREVNLTREDFTFSIMEPTRGMTLLLMTGPAPRGPVEAGCAVAVFDDKDPVGTLRYFTSESPVEPSFPWMVGEWYEGGSRGNLGGLTDVSAQGMCDFVLRHLGIATDVRLREQNAVPTRPTSDVRVSFSADWTASPSQLANETLENLHRLRLAGCRALVMNAKKVKGLSKKTASYVQFMWNDDDSLIVEIQGDYSYWGVSIPNHMVSIMEESGLSIPASGAGNFALLIPAGADLNEQQQVLLAVFRAFQDVLQPTGRIVESHF